MDDLQRKMRDDWNERGMDDPLYWTMNSRPRYEWDEDDYYHTGVSTVALNVLPFVEEHKPKPLHQMRVLDVGCGTGRITLALAEKFGTVMGVDVSDVMVDKARQHAEDKGVGNVQFLTVDGSGLPPRFAVPFDLIVSIAVIQHIPDQDIQLQYLRDIPKHINQGGLFVLHLYSDVANYERAKLNWAARAERNELIGWAEIAREEFHRWETSICHALPADLIVSTLKESGAEILVDQGAGTSLHWLMGKVR